jgi:TolB protein
MGGKIQEARQPRMTFRSIIIAAAIGALAAPALGQERLSVIAVPPLATPNNKETGAGSPAAVAWEASKLIAADLRTTAELVPIGPNQKDFYSYPEVTAPNFSRWRSSAKFLLTGFVRSQPDGRFAVGCYVYDVTTGREAGRTGFVVAPDEWRRAAHKCSGLAYTAATGAPGTFDTKIAYVAETGAGEARVKRVALMDSDGDGHSYVTSGDTTVLTPRLSPKADRIAYVSFVAGKPHVMIADLSTGRSLPLVAGEVMTFAPRFSPDGRRVVFSMQSGANADIYVADARGGTPRRLTGTPGTDTSPSFSPDGERILFESDRSGSQQLYVMNSDGTGQRRISFGGGWYASPEWSPDGEWIAFVRRIPGGAMRVGVMKPDGTGERLLTAGPSDESPSWAASSRDLVFQRTDADGRSRLYRVALSGGEPRRVATPQAASDPDWSGLLD